MEVHECYASGLKNLLAVKFVYAPSPVVELVSRPRFIAEALSISGKLLTALGVFRLQFDYTTRRFSRALASYQFSQFSASHLNRIEATCLDFIHAQPLFLFLSHFLD